MNIVYDWFTHNKETEAMKAKTVDSQKRKWQPTGIKTSENSFNTIETCNLRVNLIGLKKLQGLNRKTAN